MNAISAVGIIKNGNKYCFVVYPGGGLGFPKGTVEPGESFDQTAVREVQEETGLSSVRILNKIGVVTRIGHMNNKEVMKDIHLYQMETHDFTQGHQDETTEWLTPEEAYPRLFKEEAEFLKMYLSELE